MKRLPDLLFIVDVCREDAAVHEANLLNIPIVAMVDTNCNPNDIDYIIPSNDDAIRAIKLLVAKVADAVLEGNAMRKDEEPAEEAARPATEVVAPAQGARVIDEDDQDIEEEDLLGEATLAKLNVSRKSADEDDEDEDVEEKEKEKEEELAKSRGRKAKEEIAEAPALEEVEEKTEAEEASEEKASDADSEENKEESAADDEATEADSEESKEESAADDEATEEEQADSEDKAE
jgi:hypothetical protein